jgi:hypothetical protein
MSTLILSCLLALSLEARAQSDDEPEPEVEAASHEGGGKKGGGENKKKGGGNKKGGGKPHWETEPYIKPAGAASIYTAGDETFYSVGLGAEAGLKHRQVGKPAPQLFGNARVRGTYYIGTGVEGPEVRVGEMLGPWYKIVGAQTGPDVFWRNFTYNDVQTEPVTGLAWPVIGLFGVKSFGAYAGLEPSWYVSGEPEVPAGIEEQDVPFGHEFAWLAGANVSASKLRVGVSWQKRFTPFGEEQSIGVSFGL